MSGDSCEKTSRRVKVSRSSLREVAFAFGSTPTSNYRITEDAIPAGVAGARSRADFAPQLSRFFGASSRPKTGYSIRSLTRIDLELCASVHAR